MRKSAASVFETVPSSCQSTDISSFLNSLSAKFGVQEAKQGSITYSLYEGMHPQSFQKTLNRFAELHAKLNEPKKIDNLVVLMGQKKFYTWNDDEDGFNYFQKELD